MPLAFIWALVTAALPIAKMVLKGLGVGLVSYVGINVVLSQATDIILQNFSSLPIQLQQVMGLLKVDVAVNIILSAITTRIVLKGFSRVTDSKTKLEGL